MVIVVTRWLIAIYFPILLQLLSVKFIHLVYSENKHPSQHKVIFIHNWEGYKLIILQICSLCSFNFPLLAIHSTILGMTCNYRNFNCWSTQWWTMTLHMIVLSLQQWWLPFSMISVVPNCKTIGPGLGVDWTLLKWYVMILKFSSSFTVDLETSDYLALDVLLKSLHQ